MRVLRAPPRRCERGESWTASEAFAPPERPGVQFKSLLTIFLNANEGSGGINSVINGVGGSSTAANADQPVDVASYP